MSEEKKAGKAKKGKAKKIAINEFTVLYPNAAGIDVSSKDYVIAVPPGRDKEPIKTFGCFTCDLKLIAMWLLSCKMLIIYYHMATKKEPFNNELFEQQQKMNNQKRILFLKKQLSKLEDAA
ncbi:MAG: hypothetical protein GXO81_02505 [Chlorobi bacterium]|nr:hypothetical protein [Chlorobiota bacterium]